MGRLDRRQTFAFSCLCIALLGAGGLFADQSPEAAPRPVKVFILAGQSNMDGRGDASRLTAEDRDRLARVRDRVKVAYNGAAARALDVTRPLPHISRKFNLEQTFGPELFFGIEIAEARPESRFLFIKRSKGGTSLYGAWNPRWSPDQARLMGEEDQSRLYFELLDDIKAGLAEFDAGEFELAGMLWVQGEADSGVGKYGPEPAEKYADNLRLLVNSIRADLGVPGLPFLMLEVGGGKVVDGMRTVSTTVPGVHFIPQSRDPSERNYLSKYGPPVGHYDYEGMKRIGELFAEQWLAEQD